jgi:hypothetical protein
MAPVGPLREYHPPIVLHTSILTPLSASIMWEVPVPLCTYARIGEDAQFRLGAVRFSSVCKGLTRDICGSQQSCSRLAPPPPRPCCPPRCPPSSRSPRHSPQPIKGILSRDDKFFLKVFAFAESTVPIWFLRPSYKLFISWHCPFNLKYF